MSGLFLCLFSFIYLLFFIKGIKVMVLHTDPLLLPRSICFYKVDISLDYIESKGYICDTGIFLKLKKNLIK